MAENKPVRLVFRVPDEYRAPTLDELLARAWPEANERELKKAFSDNRVQVEGRVTRNPEKRPRIGSKIEAEVLLDPEAFGMPETGALARGDEWAIVEKPRGMPGELDRDDPMNPILYMADTLGLDRETFTPVWPMPLDAGGPWLFGRSEEDAAELLEDWWEGRVRTTWVALVPKPDVPNGTLIAPHDVRVQYSATTMREAMCEMQLTVETHGVPDSGLPDATPPELVLDALATADMPAIGDRFRGGFMANGGVRLQLAAVFGEREELQHSWQPDERWWPSDPIVPAPVEKPTEATEEEDLEERDEAIDELLVSETTLATLRETNYPWVLSDAETGRRQQMSPGTLVQLRGTNDELGPLALIEGTGKLAARVWSRYRDDGIFFDDEVDLRVDEALTRRAKFLRETGETDLYRLIHGEADGLPGFYLDRVGPVLRATLDGPACFAFKDRVYEAIADFDPEMMILEVERLRGIERKPDEFPARRAQIVRGESRYLKSDDWTSGRERGLKFWCNPWNIGAIGFSPEHRENRRKLREYAHPGQDWLDLMGPSGGFTVTLANLGVDVVAVDPPDEEALDVPARLRAENLSLNGVENQRVANIAEHHPTFVAETTKTFDGILVDLEAAITGYEIGGPATDERRDAQLDPEAAIDFLQDCFACLEPEATMLVCLDEPARAAGLEEGLDSLIQKAAERGGWSLSTAEASSPPDDYPSLDNFPEGEPFAARWIAVG